jgi:hypothetical protein
LRWLLVRGIHLNIFLVFVLKQVSVSWPPFRLCIMQGMMRFSLPPSLPPSLPLSLSLSLYIYIYIYLYRCTSPVTFVCFSLSFYIYTHTHMARTCARARAHTHALHKHACAGEWRRYPTPTSRGAS